MATPCEGLEVETIDVIAIGERSVNRRVRLRQKLWEWLDDGFFYG